MSIFNEDRGSLNKAAVDFDEAISKSNFDDVLRKAFDAGMNIDEIMYVIMSHTERTVRRYVVQHQLKQAANKDK